MLKCPIPSRCQNKTLSAAYIAIMAKNLILCSFPSNFQALLPLKYFTEDVTFPMQTIGGGGQKMAEIILFT